MSEISERLVEHGHDVTVHTADAGEEGERRENRRGVKIIRHPGLAPSGAFHIAPAILRAVQRSQTDVVHGHNYHSLPLLFAALGVDDERFVATPHYHGTSPSRVRNWLLKAYRPIGRRVLGRAEAVVAVSDWERSRLAADIDIDATVIPNGIDAGRFSQADPEERDQPYFLIVGRIEQYKGIQHAIRALPLLDGYELVVAGTGPYRSRLKRIARRADVSDRVTFLGRVNESRLLSLYAGASTCLVLSSFEAYGMTVAEALASGTPCVVRDQTALSDWTSTTGVFGISTVEPEVVANAVREAIGSGGVDVELPTWDAHVTRLEACYEGPDEKT